NRQLRVPDNLLGKMIQCPSCGTKFAAQTGRPPTPGVEPVPEPVPRSTSVARREPVPAPEYQREFEVDDRPAEQPGGPVRRDVEPNRGPLVLVLGILSIVLNCFPIGIVAWVMGQRDLGKMKRGMMDPQGRGVTQAGLICGIIGTALGGLATLFLLIYFGIVFLGFSCCCGGSLGALGKISTT